MQGVREGIADLVRVPVETGDEWEDLVWVVFLETALLDQQNTTKAWGVGGWVGDHNCCLFPRHSVGPCMQEILIPCDELCFLLLSQGV